MKRYESEEVPSTCGYISGYKPGMMDIDRQISVLQQKFLGLGGANSDYLAQVMSGSVELPQHAEKFVAVPDWKARPDIFGRTYSEAVLKMLDAINQPINQQGRSRLDNCREGKIDEAHLRQLTRTEKFFQELSDVQGNPDILIVPIQFGLRHSGRSGRRAREVFQINEFGLGAFTVGAMIVTHPERLKHYDDLWVDCAGDEFNPASDGAFSSVLFFGYSFGLGFVSRDFSLMSGGHGAASGFLLQQ